MDFSSTADDGAAHVFYDAGKPVGADMGMGIYEDGGGGSVLTEDVEDPVGVAAFLAAGVELAVGEGSCSSFPEGIVGFGVYGMFARDEGYVLPALMDVFSALDDDGTYAELDETEGCKEASRTGSDDDGFGMAFDIGIVGVDVFTVGGFFADIGAYLEVDVYDALAGIYAALEYAHVVDGFCIESLVGVQKLLYGLFG